MMGRHLKCLMPFFFSSSIFILQVRCKLETSITNIRDKNIRFQPGMETAWISQMLSDQLNTFNIILGYWKNQYETTSEINSQFENLKMMGKILEEQEKTTFPSSL